MNKLDIDKHFDRHKNILNRIIRNDKLNSNRVLVNNTKNILKEYDKLLNSKSIIGIKGSKSKEHLHKISNNLIETKELLEKMDDKFLLFVVGTGNYGKSTLINALLHKEVAAVDFRPKTWKIDVYYLDEKNTSKVIVKLSNGKSIVLSKEEAISYIEKEEKLMEESLKKYNKIKNVELKKCKTKDERDEMIQKLSKEHLYRSPVVEVRWPVKDAPLLKNILLVDTPGLTQDLYDIKNSIRDYYFKADGILWLLDAQTISASNCDNLVNDLENYLLDIGGINNNIIGVINKIDKISDSSNPNSIKDVLKDANKYFGKRFTHIMPISSKNAFLNKDDIDLKNLNNIIETVFISDSNTIKLEMKNIGVDKITKKSISENKDFIKYIKYMNSQYSNKNNQINEFIKDIKIEIKKDIKTLIDSYMSKTISNIEILAGKLFDIRDQNESREYVINKIFELSSFERRIQAFLSSKISIINTEADEVYKNFVISQYKYINHIIDNKDIQIQNISGLKLQVNGNFNNYNSLGDFVGDSIFSILGMLVNGLYRGIVKMFKIDSVKANLIDTISEITKDAENNLMENLNNEIELIELNSLEILDNSYKNVLFPFFKHEEINEVLIKFNNSVVEKESLSLIDVFY